MDGSALAPRRPQTGCRIPDVQELKSYRCLSFWIAFSFFTCRMDGLMDGSREEYLATQGGHTGFLMAAFFSLFSGLGKTDFFFCVCSACFFFLFERSRWACYCLVSAFLFYIVSPDVLQQLWRAVNHFLSCVAFLILFFLLGFSQDGYTPSSSVFPPFLSCALTPLCVGT